MQQYNQGSARPMKKILRPVTKADVIPIVELMVLRLTEKAIDCRKAVGILESEGE